MSLCRVGVFTALMIPLALAAGCRWSLLPGESGLTPPPAPPDDAVSVSVPLPADEAALRIENRAFAQERSWGTIDVRRIPGARDAYLKTTWADGRCEFRVFIDGLPSRWTKVAQEDDARLFQMHLCFQGLPDCGFALPARGFRMVREGGSGLSLKGTIQLTREGYRQLRGWRLFWKEAF